jgi:hypothetical protein
MLDYLKKHPWLNHYKDFVAELHESTDYLFGENWGEVDIDVANWAPYLPANERQRRYSLETYACGPFTVCNILEALFNYLYRNNHFSREDKKWLDDNGYLVNGSFEFSDRYVAWFSDITKGVGTSFSKVGTAVRHYGLVPEAMFPYPEDGKWDTYYQYPTEEAVDLGQEFLQRFQPVHKTIFEKDFNRAVRKAPLQVAVWAWLSRGGEYYNPYGRHNHFTTYFKNDTQPLAFDTYQPFIKELAHDYDYFYYGYQWAVKLKKNNNMMKLIKVENSPHYYAISPNGQRIRITSWGSLQQGENGGLWKIDNTETVTEGELKKHPDGGELGYLL